ncbi:hypothetical protein AVEN_90695-1 [Araneus ventricosus]|uniref:Peptidase A2 domain-containing protein n=1 Tax=Araneus ventricosus TaxID=182803 RepID=A0A4Y2KSE7_ARAVE|nr:hypothetical protein AVEN_90695-1 [Araneus ventricosus]
MRSVQDVTCITENKETEPYVVTDVESDFFIDSVSVLEVGKVTVTNEWAKKIQICNHEIDFKLDTGAQISVLPLHIFSIFNNDLKMETTNIVLEAYGGYKLRPVGMINLLCSIGNKQANINFVIIENSKSKPLLGLEGCIKLNLVKCIDKVSVNMYQTKTKQFIENNKEIFTGVGKFEGKYTIKLKENSVPIAGPPRRIPVSLRPKLEKKFKKLENEGIIAKVDNPQGWVSNLVVVEKTGGSIMLCLDPKDLNKVIKRDYVLIPKIEELVPK